MDSIKTKPSNRAEIDEYKFLYVFGQDLKETKKVMEKRVRLIPGGWRDLCMIQSAVERLAQKLLLTYEPDKRRKLDIDARSVYCKLCIGPQASASQEIFVTEEKDMKVIMCAAAENCKLCLEESGARCGQCKLGKALDNTSFISRQDRTWRDVFSTAYAHDIGKEPGYHAEE